MEWNGKNTRHLWNKNNVHGCFSIFSLIIIFYVTEWKGTKKTNKYLWNKNNVLGCFSIFSLNFLIIFFGAKCNGTDKLIDRTEWNVMEKMIYIMERNGTEKLI